MKRRLRAAVAVLALAWLGGWAMAACDARTSGVKLNFKAAAKGSFSSGKAVGAFENRRKWKITFEQAHMLVGPFYLLEGEPQVRLWRYLRPWGVAYAHVNANGQRVLAELREHFVVDLLKPTATSLGTMRGIAGLAQTAELYLLPPGGTRLSSQSMAASHVGGATVRVRGSATLGSETRAFQLLLTLPKADRMQLVSNVSTEVTFHEGSVGQGQLLLQIYLDRWFTNVDFGGLTEKDKEGRYLLTAADHAIVQGVRSRHSYHLSWRPN